jgi:hypothetical protein
MTASRRRARLLVTALAATLPVVGAVVVAAPAQAAWTPTLRWHGAVTQACRTPLDNGKVRVEVRVNNTRGTDRASGGLNRVRANGTPGNAWTYTDNVAPGAVSDTVSLTFAPGSKVWLLVGSRVGITGEDAYPLRGLARC